MNKEDLLKIFKNKNNRLICLILIIGVVLMAVASVDKNKKADVQPTAVLKMKKRGLRTFFHRLTVPERYLL